MAKGKQQEQKSKRGGARSGAGRPKTNNGFKAKRSLYCTLSELNLLRAVLKEYRAGNYDKTIKQCRLLEIENHKEADQQREEGRKNYKKGLEKKQNENQYPKNQISLF